MGIESRDYYRNGEGGGGGWSSVMPTAQVCKWLILINIGVYLLQIFVARPLRRDELVELLPPMSEQEQREIMREFDPRKFSRMPVVNEWCALETDKVLHGQVWRLITTAFCHDRSSIWHILFNMLFLYWFGPTLERMYGPREFLLFYLTAAVIASLAYIGLELVTGERHPAIGASGAVMGVTMLFTIFHPMHRILLFFVIPVEMRILIVLYVIFDLHPVLLALSGERTSTGVAHAAASGGPGIRLCLLEIQPATGTDSGPYAALDTRRPPDRVCGSIVLQHADPAAADGWEKQVDRILEKIYQQGEESLTTSERKLLQRASEHLRNRRSEEP